MARRLEYGNNGKKMQLLRLKRIFAGASIRRKLIWILMLTSVIALLMACAAFIVYEIFSFREQLVSTVSGQSQIVAINSSAALVFGDEISAENSLQAFSADPHYLFAALLDDQKSVLATYSPVEGVGDKQFTDISAGYHFDNHRLKMFQPVFMNDNVIGMLYVEYDLSAMYARLWRYIGIAAVVFLLSILIALMLATRLHPLISSPILHLANVANQVSENRDYTLRADQESDDEIGLLIAGFNEMLDEIQKRDIELAHMLDNLDEGIFTINPDLSVNAQHSRQARNLFGIDSFRDSEIAQILAVDDTGMTTFRKWVNLLKEPRFLKNWRRYEALNPVLEMKRRNEKGERVLKIRYKPVIESGQLERIMVLATDITDRRKSELALAESKAAQKNLQERIVAFGNNDFRDIELFLQQLDQAKQRLKTYDPEAPPKAIEADVFREIHTIKGNAGTFGFNSLVKSAAVLEDVLYPFLKNDKSGLDKENWQQFAPGLENFCKEISALKNLANKLYPDRGNIIEVDAAIYQNLIAKIDQSAVSADEIRNAILNLHSRPFEKYCRKYQHIVSGYREKFNKNIMDLEVLNGRQRVPRNIMAALDPCVVHLMRNAVDHGLEADEERAVSGKGAGRITLSIEIENATLSLAVADDGRGLQAGKIASRALECGIIEKAALSKMNDDQKIGLILLPGFTTRQNVNDISGRGIGMDAVREVLLQLGGDLEIASRPGFGTTFMMRVKMDAFKKADNRSIMFDEGDEKGQINDMNDMNVTIDSNEADMSGNDQKSEGAIV